MKITTVKEKAKAIWRKHKGKILFVMTAVGIVVVCRKIDQKRSPSVEEIEDAVKRELLESEQAARKEIESTKEEMSEFDRKMNDPANQIPGGGWVLEDWLRNSDPPEIIANDVPVSSLGLFGEEMIRRAEGADLGRFNQDLTKARCSIMANFQMPEEEETENE